MSNIYNITTEETGDETNQYNSNDFGLTCMVIQINVRIFPIINSLHAENWYVNTPLLELPYLYYYDFTWFPFHSP